MSFLEFYQNLPLIVDPVLFSIGNFQLRWYSLGYIIAFLLSSVLAKYRIGNKEFDFPIKKQDFDELLIYLMLAVILGGRFGYVFFYNFEYYLAHPLEIILPFRFDNGIQFVGISGLSYHGGLIACILAIYYFAKKKNFPPIKVMDLIVSVVPIGYTFGRLGNFMNGELYGRVTNVPWGMYFLDESGNPFTELRHPSQLYEAFVEGILLFVVLWLVRNKVQKGVLGGLYLIGYGGGRWLVEFFRKPDDIFKDPGEEIGTVFFFFSMGQELSFIMVLFGAWVIYHYRSQNTQNIHSVVENQNKKFPQKSAKNRKRKR